MKRTLAMLLALAILLSLCACGSDAKTTDPTEQTPSTAASNETNEDATEDTTGNVTDDATESATENATESATENVTQVPAQTPTETSTQTPTQAPAACSHSWKAATCTAAKTCALCGATEGKPIGHSWADATCEAPKTCKTCKITEGAAGAHSFADGVCTVCGAADSANPKGKISADEYIGNFKFDEEYGSANASVIWFREEGCMLANWFLSENPEGAYTLNGKKYESDGVGGGAVLYRYEITDSEIIITNQLHEEASGVVCLKLIMLSGGQLKVTYSTRDEEMPVFPVGAVLYCGREAAAESVK